jgi:phospholipase/carboxylesterase
MDLLGLGPELDERLFVISARAPYTLMPGSYQWYDLYAAMAGTPTDERIEHSLGLVEGLVDRAVKTYPIDPRRLYVGGFSMGGAMTLAALLTFPEKIAGAIVLSGASPLNHDLIWRTDEAAGKPVFQAHGTLDDVLPIQIGRATRDFLAGTPALLTYREYPIAHTVDPAELADASAWIHGLLDIDTGEAPA